MIHQIRIDDVLQVASPIVRQQYIHRLGARIMLVTSYTVVDRAYDIGMRREERVGFHFCESVGDAFLAEGAADLFEGVEGGGGGVLDEVDVGEAAL